MMQMVNSRLKLLHKMHNDGKSAEVNLQINKLRAGTSEVIPKMLSKE